MLCTDVTRYQQLVDDSGVLKGDMAAGLPVGDMLSPRYEIRFGAGEAEARDGLRRAGIVERLGERTSSQEVTEALLAATGREERVAHEVRDEIRSEVAGSEETDDEEAEAAGEEL